MILTDMRPTMTRSVTVAKLLDGSNRVENGICELPSNTKIRLFVWWVVFGGTFVYVVSVLCRAADHIVIAVALASADSRAARVALAVVGLRVTSPRKAARPL